MPAISYAAVTGIIALPSGLAKPMPGPGAEAPGVVEIIFAACALEAGHVFAVNIKKVVAFAEPTVLGEGDGHDGADVSAASLEVGDEIVAPHDRRIFLAIAGVKAGRVLGQAVQLHPIHLPIEPGGAIGIVVADDDAGGFGKGHAPKATQRPRGRNLHRHALDRRGSALADGEKFGQRRLDGRFVLAVPKTRRERAFNSETRPAWLVIQMCVMTPGPCKRGISMDLPGGRMVMSSLPLFQLGCSLLETRRLRPAGREVSAPSGSPERGVRAPGPETVLGRGWKSIQHGVVHVVARVTVWHESVAPRGV